MRLSPTFLRGLQRHPQRCSSRRMAASSHETHDIIRGRFSSTLAAPTNNNNSNTTTTTTTTTTMSPSERGKAFAALLPPPPLERHYKRVVLIRHGQTDWNLRGLLQGGGFDLPLNDNGLDQAARVADELSTLSWSIMASSHLQRAVQTADKVLSLVPNNNNDNTTTTTKRVIDHRFEEMRFGDFEGTVLPNNKDIVMDSQLQLQQEQFLEMMQKVDDDITLAWPGDHAESILQVSQRGAAAVYDLLRQNNDDDNNNIGIVAHGRFNKILLATLLWNDPSRYLEFEQGNTCINVLDFDCDNYNGNDNNNDKQRWKPILINYTHHAANAGTVI